MAPFLLHRNAKSFQKEDLMRYTKIVFMVVSLLFFVTTSADASVYIFGKLYADGEGYTEYGSVQLNCYTEDGTPIIEGAGMDAEGNFSFDTSVDYGPCGAQNAGLEYKSCTLYPYQSWTDTVHTQGDAVPIELNCAGLLEQDLSLSGCDKTIAITIMADGEPVTENMEVFCSQRNYPYSSFLATSPTGEAYIVNVPEGTYMCFAQCTSSCNLGGTQMADISLGSEDESASATINFTINDKVLRVALVAGGEPITSGMSVSAWEEGGNGSSLFTDTAVGGIYQLNVGTASYYVSAYCNYGAPCNASGYPYATVLVEEGDSVIDITLTFVENDSTISGIVTDGTEGVVNANVSVYSYSVESEYGNADGVAMGDDGGSAAGNVAKSLLDKAVTEVWESDSSTIYNSAVTDENGAFEVMVPAGTYTLAVWPPYERTDLGQSSIVITTTTGTTTVANIALPIKTAIISGSVKDANDNGVLNVYINGWSFSGMNGTSDNFYAQTDEDGNYSVYAIEGLTYNVTANYWTDNLTSTICMYNNERMQSVTASSEEEVINFTYPTCDCTLTVNTVDLNGDLISSIYGGVDATPASFDEEDMWYGTYGYLSNGIAGIRVQSGVEYNISVYSSSDEYVPGDDVAGTCSDGATSVDYEMLPLDATISGSFVDSDGNPISVEDYNRIYVNASKGFAYRNCDTSADGFSCQVSAGEWCVGHWVDPTTGYASTADGFASGCISMESGESETQDIILYKTGSIVVTAIDHLGEPKPNVFIEATPYSNSDNGESDSEFMPNGCQTDSEGACTIDVAATADGVVYYLNAYVPYYLRSSENIMLPLEISVTVIEDEETVAETLVFREPDGTSVITLVEGSAEAALSLGKSVSKAGEEGTLAGPIAYATVDCFSSTGGSFEVETDEIGVATCPCTTSDSWYVVANNMVSNNLWMSEVAEITCLEDGGVGEVTINNIATVPEGQSMTISDAGSQTLTITLSDGFEVSFPSGALGGDGETATCNVDIVVTPITANKIPASFYGYGVSCMDGEGVSIIQLNNNATFRVPINLGQVENLNLTLDTIEMTYFNTSNGAYDTIDGYAIDTTNNFITYQQNHLTSFIIVGNGDLNSITGEEGGDEVGDNGDDDGGEDAGGGDDVTNGAAAASGCGCNVASETPLSDKLMTGMIFIMSLVGLKVAGLCMKRTKK